MAVLNASPAVVFDGNGIRRFPARSVRPVRLALPVPVALAMAVAAAFLVALAASVTWGGSAVPVDAPPPPAVVVVESSAHPAWTVASGDTLWTIAQRARPGADPRAVVLEIQVLNALSPAHVLQAGEVLLLPGA
jgi:Tfp pilus assembly protein FimV